MGEIHKVPQIKHQIDFVEYYKYFMTFKKLYLKVGLVVFVFSSIYVFSLPRFYTTQVKLAPEESSGGSGMLGSLASLANIKLGSSSSGDDAIYPELYPDLFKSKSFLVSLFDIKLHAKGSDESFTLYEYYLGHQKIPFWQYPINAVINWLGSLRKPDPSLVNGAPGKTGVNPFHLSLLEDGIAQMIGGAINCTVDKHTDVITIQTTAQDPVVSALLADSVMSRLQNFIAHYRTNKARVDVAYSEKLLAEAKMKYDETRMRYTSYADTHNELYMVTYKTELTNLENEMQLAYNVYSQVMQQLQISQAKVQECTPAFTTIEAATVPLLPAGPKRVKTILIHLFLSVVIVSGYLYFRKEKDKQNVVEKHSDEPFNPEKTSQTV